MRSDESASRRVKDLDILRGYVNGMPVGLKVPIETWYTEMEQLGMGRSDRQRLSELRQEGYDIRYERKLRAYIYYGFSVSRQAELFETMGAFSG